MKNWTTPAQLAWLKQRVPDWLKARHKKGGSTPFLSETIADFLVKFKLDRSERIKSSSRIKKWFYHHATAKSRRIVKPDLLSKPPRKVVRLTQAQAYSLLFCKRGSSMHKKLVRAWKLYKSADEDTVSTYKHLFPSTPNPKMPFVTFQQAVIKEEIATATEEDLVAIQEYIDTRFEADTKLRERPWEALKVDELQENVDLERRYVKEQVEGLTLSLEAVCDEVKRTTNYNSFILTGGPSPMGEGGYKVQHVEAGETSLSGQSFQQYLGPWWDVLTTKYGEWLGLSYSHEEWFRLPGFVRGQAHPSRPNRAALATSPAPTSTHSHTPDPKEMSGDTELDTDTEMGAVGTSTTPARPKPTPRRRLRRRQSTVDRDTLDDTLDDSMDNTLDRTLNEIVSDSEPAPSSPDHMSPKSPRSRASIESPRGRTPALSPRGRISTPSPSPSTHSESQEEGWVPSHDPSWTLGPQHHQYVHAAAPYLIGVPGGPAWESLLASYIIFESLSSARPGSPKLPAKPRPEEVGRWFRNGRRGFRKQDVPTIKSIRVFEKEWVEWWSAAQPEWRDTSDWPFEQEDADGHDWGGLIDGGKDGLYVVMVSLGWWVHAKDSSEDSKIDEAIEDVAWVIDSLVSLLSAAATATPTPPRTSQRGRRTKTAATPAPPRTTQRGKHAQTIKVGPPGKRAKRGHT